MPETLDHTYQPLGAARELFLCKDPEVLISGPAGTGKSRACLEKILALCLKYPGLQVLVARKTQSSLAPSVLKTWKRDVIPELLAAGAIHYYGGSGQEPSQYRFGNGSSVVLGGLDKTTKIMSTEYDIIYVNESIELTENDWEALTTRLRSNRMPYQQLVGDTNPGSDIHWLKQRCDKGNTKMLDSRLEDNPVYFDDTKTLTPLGIDYVKKLDNLTGVRKERLRFGRWVASEGMIYDEFDKKIHVVPRFDVPDDWDRIWAIDFGYTNPFVWQEWVIDNDGNIYLNKEIYYSGRIVEDHVKKIRTVATNLNPLIIVADHDAEDRATFTRHMGLSTQAALKNVSEGIQAVQSRLRKSENGKPKLCFIEDVRVEVDPKLRDASKPTCTLEEITGYTWHPDPSKEEPVKSNDHGMDAMRYAVQNCDNRIKFSIGFSKT